MLFIKDIVFYGCQDIRDTAQADSLNIVCVVSCPAVVVVFSFRNTIIY